MLVFIHGGNNQTGNTKEILGSELVVRDNCVFVTLDYRLGDGDYALHELHLTFYKDKYDRWMPRFNTAYPANDEYTDVRDFMDALYGFYQQSVVDAG